MTARASTPRADRRAASASTRSVSAIPRRSRAAAPTRTGTPRQLAPASSISSASASSARRQPIVVPSETIAMSGRAATGARYLSRGDPSGVPRDRHRERLPPGAIPGAGAVAGRGGDRLAGGGGAGGGADRAPDHPGRRGASRGLGPLSRGHVGAGRAPGPARELPGSPGPGRPVRPVGHHLGPPPDAGPRPVVAPHQGALPAGRRGGHLR